ncbi:hypothetical protein Tco_0076934 [Tanacetum coccineum]
MEILVCTRRLQVNLLCHVHVLPPLRLLQVLYSSGRIRMAQGLNNNLGWTYPAGLTWLDLSGWASRAGLLRLGFPGWITLAGLLRLDFPS